VIFEYGRDFDEAKEQAARAATDRDVEFAPLFHRDFVIGVATYAYDGYALSFKYETE
jgi:threonine dehydratase